MKAFFFKFRLFGEKQHYNIYAVASKLKPKTSNNAPGRRAKADDDDKEVDTCRRQRRRRQKRMQEEGTVAPPYSFRRRGGGGKGRTGAAAAAPGREERHASEFLSSGEREPSLLRKKKKKKSEGRQEAPNKKKLFSFLFSSPSPLCSILSLSPTPTPPRSSFARSFPHPNGLRGGRGGRAVLAEEGQRQRAKADDRPEEARVSQEGPAKLFRVLLLPKIENFRRFEVGESKLVTPMFTLRVMVGRPTLEREKGDDFFFCTREKTSVLEKGAACRRGSSCLFVISKASHVEFKGPISTPAASHGSFASIYAVPQSQNLECTLLLKIG